MEEPIVTIEHVSKSFGNQEVLTDISFSMVKGKITVWSVEMDPARLC